jgi:dolichol kinase
MLVPVSIMVFATMALQWLFWSAASPPAARTKPKLSRPELHFARRAQHALTGTLFSAEVVCCVIPSPQIQACTLFVCSGCFYGIHRLRLRNSSLNNRLVAWYGPLLRADEAAGKLPAACFFMLGCGLTILIFSNTAAVIGIMCLSWGDPCAGVVGSLYGRRRFTNGKSLEGSLSCVLVCSFVAFMSLIFLGPPTLPILTATLLSFSIGLVSAIVELLSPKELDDNLCIPFVVAACVDLLLAAVLSGTDEQ